MALNGSSDYFLVNPASIAGQARWGVSAQGAAWLVGFSDGSELSQSDWRASGPVGPVSLGMAWVTRGLKDFFREETVGLAAAWPSIFGGGEVFGLQVKWLNVAQSPVFSVRANPGFGPDSVQAFSLDAGVQWEMMGVRMGLAVTDLLQPQMSLVNEAVGQPREVRLGIAGKWGEAWNIVADPAWRDGLWRVGVGVERLASEGWPMIVRTGWEFASPAGGAFQLASWRLGLGWDWRMSWGSLGLQYGWSFPFSGWAGGLGTHVFAFTVQNGSFSIPVGTVVPVVSVGLTGVKGMDVPPAPIPFTRLESIEKERLFWQERSESMKSRHRGAFLTALVAGSTAAESAYQELMEEEGRPTSWAPLAMKAIGWFRYGHGEAMLPRLVEVYEASASGPESGEIWLALGHLRARSGEWGLALEAFRRSSAAGGSAETEVGALCSAVVAALTLGDLPVAVSKLASLSTLAPNHPWVHELRSRVELVRNHLDEAVQALGQAEQAATDSEDQLRIGLLKAAVLTRFHRFERYQQALDLTDDLAVRFPGEDRLAPFRRGVIQAAVQAYGEEARQSEERLLVKEALLAYQHMLTFQPDHPEALARVSRVRERIAEQIQSHAARAVEFTAALDLERALGEWKLVLDADSGHREASAAVKKIIPALWSQALDRIREGAYREAVKIYHTIDEAEPNHPETAEGRALVKRVFTDLAAASETSEEYAKARQSWREYLKLIPGDAGAAAEIGRLEKTGREKATAYVKEAEIAGQKTQWTAALLLAEKALRSEPEFEPALAVRTRLDQERAQAIARVLVEAEDAARRGQMDVAADRYEKVLQYDPGHVQAKTRLEEIRKQSTVRSSSLWREATEADARWKPEVALERLERLLAVQSNHQEGLELRRTIQARLERARGARARVESLNLKGDLAYGQGRMAEAIAAWEEAVSLDYYHADLRQKIDGVRKEIKP